MKRLLASELLIELPLRSIDLGKTFGVLDVVQRFSAAEALPWRARTWSAAARDLVDVEGEAVSALRGALEKGYELLYLRRQWRWPDAVDERISFRFEYHGRQEVAIEVCVAERDLIPFFIDLTEVLAPRHGSFVPRYETDTRVGLQAVILEMALQRDYGLIGRINSDEPALLLARNFAAALPRIAFSVPEPEGLPARLGWLNYWHEEVAKELGFPDPEKDSRLLPLCRRTESGAWIVQLTEAPLDLERADHVETLVWAYWRFDKIGKRMRPAARKTKPRAKQADADVASALGLKVFSLRERDQNGQWWDSAIEPIRAASADEALRIHFARMAYSRLPKKGESLGKLRDMYDRIAAEVGMVRGEDVEAVEATRPSAG